MTPEDLTVHLPSYKTPLDLQGHWTSGLFPGGYFLRHVAFASTEVFSPLLGPPGRKVYPILSVFQHSGVTFLPGNLFGNGMTGS